MAAKRCSYCSIDWPVNGVSMKSNLVKFDVCPVCGVKTEPMSDVSPISYKEAKRTVAEVHFTRYCEERQKRRAAEGVPDPSQVERSEIREIVSLERAFRAPAAEPPHEAAA